MIDAKLFHLEAKSFHLEVVLVVSWFWLSLSLVS